MKKIKMARETTLTFEEGCNKYLENDPVYKFKNDCNHSRQQSKKPVRKDRLF